MIKFLHVADLHLDAPFHGLPPDQAAARRREQRAMVEEIIALTNDNQCQLLLIAGDLFDGTQVYEDTIDTLMQAFARCKATVFIAPGNHDSSEAHKSELQSHSELSYAVFGL